MAYEVFGFEKPLCYNILSALKSTSMLHINFLGVNNPYVILYIYTLSALLSTTVQHMKFLCVNKPYVILKEINQPTQNILK